MGQTVQLPCAALGDADHAAVAINARGDIFVAWSSRRTDLSSRATQVDGCLLTYLGSGTWDMPTLGYNCWVLGSAEASVFGSGYDSCRKPDVVAVGDDFVVTWPRSNGARAMSRLEMVRVRCSPGALPFIETAAPGIGFLIDPLLESKDAGAMPDLVTLSVVPPVVGVVYVEDERRNPPYREFDLRFCRADFSVLPPAVDGPMVLVDDLPQDDPPISGEPAGGKVLPELELDDQGNLVLAYESYVRYAHFGWPWDEGRVHVEWFCNGASGLPSLLQGIHFNGRTRSSRVRRPSLSASRLDRANTVSLSFMDAPDNLGDFDVVHRELSYAGGVITDQDFGYPNAVNRSDSMPVVAHGGSLRLSLAIHKQDAREQVMAFAPSFANRPFVDMDCPVAHPWRPSIALLEPAPPDLPSAGVLLPVSYEGPGTPGGPLRIYLIVHAL